MSDASIAVLKGIESATESLWFGFERGDQRLRENRFVDRARYARIIRSLARNCKAVRAAESRENLLEYATEARPRLLIRSKSGMEPDHTGPDSGSTDPKNVIAHTAELAITTGGRRDRSQARLIAGREDRRRRAGNVCAAIQPSEPRTWGHRDTNRTNCRSEYC